MNEDKVFTAWISKNALSRGIFTVKVRQSTESPSLVVDDRRNWFHGEGGEWHRDRAGAVKRAEEMRVAKIASLEKQIAKLEAMRFD